MPYSGNQLTSFLTMCIWLLWIPHQNLSKILKGLLNSTTGRRRNNYRKTLCRWQRRLVPLEQGHDRQGPEYTPKTRWNQLNFMFIIFAFRVGGNPTTMWPIFFQMNNLLLTKSCAQISSSVNIFQDSHDFPFKMFHNWSHITILHIFVRNRLA